MYSLFPLTILVLAALGQARDVKKAFSKANITPNIVPTFEPTIDLHVTYVLPNTTTLKSVKFGNVLPVSGERRGPFVSMQAY
jgi:hypothetical protein